MSVADLDRFGQVVGPSGSGVNAVSELQYLNLGLYFTATWCPSCHQLARRLPSLVSLANKSNPNTLKLLTIRLDDEDTSNFGYSFYRFKKIQLSYAQQISTWFRVRFLPTLLIFNKQGKCVSYNGAKDLATFGQSSGQQWAKRSL